VSGQLHAAADLLPGERTLGMHWIGNWMGTRAGLDDMEKGKFLTLLGLELQNLGSPARNQSLYRLRYPGSLRVQCTVLKLIFCASALTSKNTGTQYINVYIYSGGASPASLAHLLAFRGQGKFFVFLHTGILMKCLLSGSVVCPSICPH
jgi:hypothetical protein